MYNNIGKLIGFYRKQRFRLTKDIRYSQVNFAKYNQRNICSQSKLSDIENGNVKIPYTDNYHYLIQNLDFIPIDYFKVEGIYSIFLAKFLYALQYEDSESYFGLQVEFESKLEKFDKYFYLFELNEIIRFTFLSIKGISLPNIKYFDFYIDSIHCYCNEMQCLILNLAFQLVESYDPSQEAINRITLLLMKNEIKNSLIEVLMGNLHISQGNFKRANRILSLVKKDKLSDYLKFKIDLLRFKMRTEKLSTSKLLVSLQNFSTCYPNICRFEYYKPFLHIATLLYSKKEYDFSYKNYLKAIEINPEVSCLTLIYIFDCLYELNRLNEFESLKDISIQYLEKFPKLYRDISSFCSELSCDCSSFLDTSMLNSLFVNLSTLKHDNQYIRIVRKHLLLNVTKTHKYKLFCDFEKFIYNSKGVIRQMRT